MRVFRKYHHSLVFLFLLMMACTPKHYVDKSHDAEYKKQEKEIETDYVIYHYDELNSRIYFSINNKNVIYKKTDTSKFFVASLKLSYKITADPDSRQILDSSTFSITDKTTEVLLKQITGSHNFNYLAGNIGYMEISAWDENRKSKNVVQIKLNKSTDGGAQNFLIRRQDSSVAFSSRLPLGTFISAEHNRNHPTTTTTIVEFYKRNNRLPPPPFSDVSYLPPTDAPDSSFSLAQATTGKFNLVLNKPGIFCFKLQASSSSGCSVFAVDSDFPKVTTHEQMIACTRYILSKDEFNKLNTAVDKQKAIDDFWIGIAGSADRARAMIKKYYNRVQDANDMFSSSQEGWKTDRGMIYIIFGAPQKVYKTMASETWAYNESTQTAIQFVFDRVENKFSDNDYFLNRSINFKDPWYFAVNAWREGRIYLDN